MPVFNSGVFLKQAVDSILAQTFRDFEFLVLDGGSTDSTVTKLAEYAKQDSRVAVAEHPGVSFVDRLNLGCREAEGEFIARMDSDDVSFPERFALQVKFMDKHPDAGVLGTDLQHVDQLNRYISGWGPPTRPGMIRWTLLFENCVAHPTVMARRSVLERLRYYDPEMTYAEDYDIWARASRMTRVTNLPEVLLYRRIWEGAIGTKHNYLQWKTHHEVMLRGAESLLGEKVPLQTIEDLRTVCLGGRVPSLERLRSVATLLTRLATAFQESSDFSASDRRAVRKDAGRKLRRIALLATQHSRMGSVKVFREAVRTNPGLVLPIDIGALMAAAVRRGDPLVASKTFGLPPVTQGSVAPSLQLGADEKIPLAEVVPIHQGRRFEVNNWKLSTFVVGRLVSIVGVHPYPINELNLMAAAVCYFRPSHIFEWGTHLGISARIFSETATFFGVPAEIHSIDLTPETKRVENPGERRGEFVRGRPDVRLHLGDGVETALQIWKAADSRRQALFFVDGDHEFASVQRELEAIDRSVDDPVIIVHDSFDQTREAGYNTGPRRAVEDFLAHRPNKYLAVEAQFGLPGMTLLYRPTERNLPEPSFEKK